MMNTCLLETSSRRPKVANDTGPIGEPCILVETWQPRAIKTFFLGGTVPAVSVAQATYQRYRKQSQSASSGR